MNSANHYTFIDRVPNGWIEMEPAAKSLITANSDPKTDFLIVKCPLSSEVNKIFPTKLRWAASDARNVACNFLDQKDSNIRFHLIDVDPDGYLNEPEIEEAGFVLHVSPITKDKLSVSLSNFLHLIEELTSASDYDSNIPILISDRVGLIYSSAAVVYYLIKKCGMSLPDTLASISAAREYGLCSPGLLRDIATLVDFSDPSDLISKITRPPFLLPQEEQHEEPLPKRLVEPRIFTNSFEEDPEKVNQLNSLYTETFTEAAGFTFDPIQPMPRATGRMQNYDNVLCTPSFITFIPHALCVAVLMIDPEALYVYYRFNFYRFPILSHVKSKYLPFVATAYASRRETEVVLLFADVLRMGATIFSDTASEIKEDEVNSWCFEDRLAMLWNEFIPDLNIQKGDGLRVFLRPYATFSRNTYDIVQELPKELGLEVENFAIIANKDLPGIQSILYLHPCPYFFFEVVGKSYGILYSRETVEKPRVSQLRPPKEDETPELDEQDGISETPRKSSEKSSEKAEKSSEKEANSDNDSEKSSENSHPKIVLRPVWCLAISGNEGRQRTKVIGIKIGQRGRMDPKISALSNEAIAPSTVEEFRDALDYMENGMQAHNAILRIDAILKGVPKRDRKQRDERESRLTRKIDYDKDEGKERKERKEAKDKESEGKEKKISEKREKSEKSEKNVRSESDREHRDHNHDRDRGHEKDHERRQSDNSDDSETLDDDFGLEEEEEENDTD